MLLRLLLALLLASLLLLLGSHRLLLFVDPAGLDEKSTSASPLGDHGGQHPARCATAHGPETFVTRARRSERCVTHQLLRFPRSAIQLATDLPFTATRTLADIAAGGLNVVRKRGHLFSPFVSLRAQVLFNPSAYTNASLFFVQGLRATLNARLACRNTTRVSRVSHAPRSKSRAFSRRQPRARSLIGAHGATHERCSCAFQKKSACRCLTSRAHRAHRSHDASIAVISAR